MRGGIVQVGVGRDACALLGDGDLVSWSDAPARAVLLRQVRRQLRGRPRAAGLRSIANGRSRSTARTEPRRVAGDVAAACIGDGADYYVTREGSLFVKGLAHRGQYGDGRLQESRDFVATARDAVVVRAHTGHALYLSRTGDVFGTGGNRYGPLSSHGLGDKADRWGRIFEGAVAIATGSRHSLAIRADLERYGPGDRASPSRLASCSMGSRDRRWRHRHPRPHPRRSPVAMGSRGPAEEAGPALTSGDRTQAARPHRWRPPGGSRVRQESRSRRARAITLVARRGLQARGVRRSAWRWLEHRARPGAVDHRGDARSAYSRTSVYSGVPLAGSVRRRPPGRASGCRHQGRVGRQRLQRFGEQQAPDLERDAGLDAATARRSARARRFDLDRVLLGDHAPVELRRPCPARRWCWCRPRSGRR